MENNRSGQADRPNEGKDTMMRIRLRRALAAALLLIFLPPFEAGAFQLFSDKTSPPPYLAPVSEEPATRETGDSCQLILTVRDLADILFLNLADADPVVGELADGLLITTFVDINKLYRTSSFGRYVADQLMNEFQQHAFKVIDMRKSQSVMVQEKRGEYGLSRDQYEIAPSFSAGAMLTGTYLVGEKEIIVNARILDNKTAALLSSATVTFPRNSLSDLLLKDTASARREAREVTYMKKLEL